MAGAESLKISVSMEVGHNGCINWNPNQCPLMVMGYLLIGKALVPITEHCPLWLDHTLTHLPFSSLSTSTC